MNWAKTTDFDFTIEINGTAYPAKEGETVVDVARRAGIEIPTLCHDTRLEPVGACRVCLVEIEGERRLQPSCAWQVKPNMKVTSESDRILRHRKILYSMYQADHDLDAERLPVETPNTNQLRQLCQHADTLPLEPIDAPRTGRAEDFNPYIEFNPELCILCARCTRYCDEVEAVNAITLSNRGSATTIATVADRSLIDTTCELCGGCIDTCPTGALVEKKAPKLLPLQTKQTRTTCNFCGVGCQLDLHTHNDQVVKITSPLPGETLNDGNLCVKGRFAYDFIHHEERLTEPLIRREDGGLHPVSWDEAIRVAVTGLKRVKEKHGADSLGFVSSSRCTVEENYLMQKLSRAAFGTNNIHQCAAT